jgi:hypothetical protein
MKKFYFINIAILFILGIMLIECSSPLDVPANRIIKKENEPGTGDEIFSLSTNYIEFYFDEPLGVQTKSFEIRNLLDENYTINSISFKNSEKFFSKSHHPTPISLSKANQNDSKEIVNVKFSPTEPGIFIDTILINDLKSPVVKVLATVLTIRVQELDFIDVPLGNTGNRTITVKNYGNSTAVIKGAIITDPEFVFEMEDILFPLYIQKNSSFSFWVKFTPSEKQSYTGRIDFNIQSSGIVDNVCELSGNGI